MKKTLAIALAFGVASAFAQDLTSKKGEPILPEAGDWAIGIDASPFLNYAGNMLNGNTDNAAPTFDFLAGNSAILGKMFKDEKTAYRAGIRLGFGTVKFNGLPDQDGYTGAPPTPTVTDVMKMSSRNIALTAGMEMRRGKTRLQGYYGAEAGIALGGGKTTYTYGNAYSSTNTSPTIWDFNTGTQASAGSSRVTEMKDGSSFGIGVRGFIGAEYFILPKMSIGGEFGWGLVLETIGEGSMTTESWDGSKVVNTETKTGKASAFGLDVDNSNSVFGPSATLRLNLHF